MNINFYLIDSKKPANIPRSVYLVCYLRNKLLRFNTGIHVLASQWDKAKMRVVSHHNKNVLNEKLANLASIAREYEDTLPLTTKPSFSPFVQSACICTDIVLYNAGVI